MAMSDAVSRANHRTSWCGSFEVDEVDERPATRTNKEMKMNEDENESINTAAAMASTATATATAAYLCPFSVFLFQTQT